MPSLTLKNLPEDLLESLREEAKEERRSLMAQATRMLELAAEEARRKRLLRRAAKSRPTLEDRVRLEAAGNDLQAQRLARIDAAMERLKARHGGRLPAMPSADEMSAMMDEVGSDSFENSRS